MTVSLGALLVVGAMGELGSHTVAAAVEAWNGPVIAVCHSSSPKASMANASGATWVHLDCSDHKAVRTYFAAAQRISAVIYCAVPKHRGANETGADSVRAGIVDDVVACAEAAAMIGARFVAVSTDLVHDGLKPAGERYSESDPPTPTNAYGRFKVDMERELANISSAIVIARSSLILTLGDGADVPHGKGIRFVVEAIEGRHGEIEIFEDELRNMSFGDDLGRALVELASPSCAHRGIINLVSDETTNRWELAKLLAKKLGKEDLLGVHAKSGLSKDSGMNRPLNCALSSDLAKKVLNTKIRGISERLA